METNVILQSFNNEVKKLILNYNKLKSDLKFKKKLIFGLSALIFLMFLGFLFCFSRY